MQGAFSVINCVMLFCVLYALRYHHIKAIEGPNSATARILTAMAQVTARFDMIERRLTEGGL